MTGNQSSADCIFCKILLGQTEATFLHRDERCAVFMDIRPVNPGHFLITPIDHAPYLRDVESDTLAHMIVLAKRFAGALRASGIPCEGVNFFLADGEAAMQEVLHCHLHVFPRFRNDGFGLRFGPDYSVRDRSDLEATAAQIRAALEEAN